MVIRKVKLTFPEELITEPVIYNLGHTFKVITNIKQAMVDKESGWVVLELSGEVEEIDMAIHYLRERGIKVETIGDSEDRDV